MSSTPLFVISDLHIGDHGPTDNFSHDPDKHKQLERFLGYVAEQQGELIVAGDLFEFWQANISKVIVENLALLDKLAGLNVKYIVGNHDADLTYFIGRKMLAHPVFETMSGPIERTIGGKKIVFMHGHEVDPFNCGDSPSWGRVLAIFAGIFEEKNGSPMLDTGESVEEVLTEFGMTALRLWNWATNKLKRSIMAGESPSPKSELTPAQNPERKLEMLRKYKAHREEKGYDVAIAGHTHQPGRIGDWYFNCGSWVDDNHDFIRIDSTGYVQVSKWTTNGPVPNDTVLQDV